MPDLGLNAHMLALSLGGEKSREDWRDFVNEAVKRIGMTPVGHMAEWHYPECCPKGIGPNGDIIVQPISESFIALDTWPDHKGAYLFVCSCRQFEASVVIDLCAEAGLTVLDRAGHTLSLKQ